jgi:hypothetical protein
LSHISWNKKLILSSHFNSFVHKHTHTKHTHTLAQVIWECGMS